MAPGENGGEDMIIIACTDDNQGMLFNHRRQSQDRGQRQRMLQRTGGAKLWVDTYTAGLFSAESREQLEIDDQCLEYAADGEFCFVEKENPGTVEEKIEKIILYRWNRVYPADVHFPIDFSGWKLVQAEEFAGSSHEKITEEIYERVK